jgi:rhomboid protease GluP
MSKTIAALGRSCTPACELCRSRLRDISRNLPMIVGNGGISHEIDHRHGIVMVGGDHDPLEEYWSPYNRRRPCRSDRRRPITDSLQASAREKEAMLQSMKRNSTSWKPWLSLSTGLALLTAAVSFCVAYAATGSPFGTVPMHVLTTYGGVTTGDLAKLEIWRLATAQLIHAKQAHMMLNAITLLLLGNLLERCVGRTATLFLWLLAGGAATAISPLLVAWPFNVGTGASQANFAFAGSALVLRLIGPLRGSVAWPLITLALLPGLALDLWHVGYPKLGHIAGLIFGVVSGGLLMRLERL